MPESLERRCLRKAETPTAAANPDPAGPRVQEGGRQKLCLHTVGPPEAQRHRVINAPILMALHRHAAPRQTHHLRCCLRGRIPRPV
eukprot:10815163-Alexandrium_andersonii.AAC.1